ncbi:Suppressor Mra1 family protein [Pyrolobus fumarii 1A]|uniref:Ribosomal RNA small subunit methyltransferase Nep1 n=1 Tax=Pyrolobus fumarii (strain DSM 11204 / 1A) TaxID=694429 RepID=G0EE48_PYRF1|nr:16S rRNA methyltransferase [Pyrolobus fumarii]AEM37964.1 Suppressor Mra1 family protein [Pyrolobus fumarii 1A]
MKQGNERPLKLVFFESSLELVPQELWSHPSVYKAAWKRGKQPGKTLLDSSLHHQAIRQARLPEAEKRGRPDVVHILLLEALSSPLNEAGVLEIYIHTIGDYVITVRPETRIPRNYNRFVGLIEQLFEEGRVPPNAPTPLMEIRPMTIRSLVRLLKPTHTILYSWGIEAPRRRTREIAEEVQEAIEAGSTVVLLLPGYPHGNPRDSTIEVAEKRYTPLARLEAWTLASHTLALIADRLGLL